MRKVLVLAALGAALLVSACNTVAGVGRDLEAAGQGITGSSDSARR
jgi:predicted small secreted protein